MKNFGRKVLSWIKISGLAFAMFAGTAFLASGFGMIFHASQQEKTYAQNCDDSVLQALKTEKNVGLGFVTAGSFIALGKFYLACGTRNLKSFGPTSAKLTKEIKKIYINEIIEK